MIEEIISSKDLYKHLMWDYNISIDKIKELFSGKIKSIEHYNQETLFKKVLESLPWFSILQILDIQLKKKILTKEVIKKLRSPDLRNKYFYVRDRLQEIILVPE